MNVSTHKNDSGAPRWMGLGLTGLSLLLLLGAADSNVSADSRGGAPRATLGVRPDPGLELVARIRVAARQTPTDADHLRRLYETLLTHYGCRGELFDVALLDRLVRDARELLGEPWTETWFERLAGASTPLVSLRAEVRLAELLGDPLEEPGPRRTRALGLLTRTLEITGPALLAANPDLQEELARASALRWRLRHFSIGCTVPLFRTEDRLGNEIVLDEFRGQVVLVRLWEDCEFTTAERLRHERELYGRLWDERFALIGLSTAAPTDALVRRLDELDVRWEVGYEPDVRGARAAWRLDQPGSFLLDHLGVLRGVGLTGYALEVRVGELLAERRQWARQREAMTPANASPPGGQR